MGTSTTGLSELDRARRYMARQDWLASRQELLSLGIPRSRIESWLCTERLLPVLAGVYSYGRAVETRTAAFRSALLAAGPDAALTGSSACEQLGIVRTGRWIPARVDVASRRVKATVLRGRSPGMPGTSVRVVRRDFGPDDWLRSDGLTVARAAWALLDLAAEADPVAVKFAFLEACRLGHFKRHDVDYCFPRMAGRRGATKLRPLLAGWVPELGRIKSPLEGLFVLAWPATGRPMPLINWKVSGYEVDALWEKERLIVEFDGQAYHSDPVARARDAAKDAWLRSQGYTVLRFTYRQMMEDPEWVVGEIIRALKASR